MAAVAAAVEAELDAPAAAADGPQARLHEAMRYAVLGGGKRLRPFLVAAAAELFGADGPRADPGRGRDRAAARLLAGPRRPAGHGRRGAAARPAGLPSRLRRGDRDPGRRRAAGRWRSRCWPRPTTRPTPSSACALVPGLARAAGRAGMCGGQMLDLMAERQAAGPGRDRACMQRLKTGALIRFACEAGAIARPRPPAERRAPGGYADDLGLAFQIQDDLLDGEGDSAVTGKDAGPRRRGRQGHIRRAARARPARAPSWLELRDAGAGAALTSLAAAPRFCAQLFRLRDQPADPDALGQRVRVDMAVNAAPRPDPRARRSAPARPRDAARSWRPSCGRRRSTRSR